MGRIIAAGTAVMDAGNGGFHIVAVYLCQMMKGKVEKSTVQNGKAQQQYRKSADQNTFEDSFEIL